MCRLILEIDDNNLFVPFKGENTDGHRFVAQALKDGAGAAFTNIMQSLTTK